MLWWKILEGVPDQCLRLDLRFGNWLRNNMPRFNSLRLASTGFTSWIDYYQWHSSPGLWVLPLTERMFHYELDLWQFSTRGDRTNPDRVAHNQYDVGRFRASHSEKVVTGRSLVHTISWSLFLSLSLFCCSRLGESDEIYAVYQTHSGLCLLTTGSMGAYTVNMTFEKPRETWLDEQTHTFNKTNTESLKIRPRKAWMS